MTVRLRDCEPPPHEWVHVDQLENALVMQWTGHGPWLHVCASLACGQAKPPISGCTSVRLRHWSPEETPHDFVHVDQELNVPTTQSLEHCLLYRV